MWYKDTMSPIAHTAIGILGFELFEKKKSWATLGVWVLLANIPDVDFLFGGSHQQFTHNIAFVCLLPLCLFPIIKFSPLWGMLLVGASHVFLDLLMIDTYPPIGLRIFYPFSDQVFNWGFFPYMIREGFQEIFSFHNIKVALLEGTVFWLPLALMYRKRLFQSFNWSKL